MHDWIGLKVDEHVLQALLHNVMDVIFDHTTVLTKLVLFSLSYAKLSHLCLHCARTLRGVSFVNWPRHGQFNAAIST